MPTLQPSTCVAVHDGWSRQLQVPVSLLAEPGLHVVPREDARGVVVLELGRVVVVTAPPPMTERLGELGAGRLADIDAVVTATGDPSARPIGVATLSYADRDTLAVPDPATLPGPVTPPRPAGAADVAALLAATAPDEGDESGVVDMPTSWLLPFPDGSPAAAAGYASWHDRIAQIGVLVHPAARGRGLASRVAAVAAGAALDAGLVPQWRCREGNAPSSRVAQRLGFLPVGRQLAVALDGAPA
jgi:RimJ/RimL family protein N-acetyltransferase